MCRILHKAEQLKKEYEKIAKVNQQSTQFGSDCETVHTPLGRVSDKIAKVNQGTRTDLTSCSNEQKVNTRDMISEDLGMSSTTLGRAQYISENAPEEMIKQLDDGQLSPH